MLVQIINISLTLQKIARVKLPSFHATFENSKRNSNTNGELMRGGSGGRINIYPEDLSVPSQTNEFRFRTSHFITTAGLNICIK